MRLALIQMTCKLGEVADNIDRARAHIEEAADRGAELAVLPEFFSTGFFAQEHDYRLLELAESDNGRTVSAIREVAAACGIHVVATLFEEAMPGIRFNSAFFIDPEGEVTGKYRKVHPAAVPDGTRSDWSVNGDFEKLYVRPGVEFSVWSAAGIRVGVMICYDHFFPESARCLTLNGAELIVGPFAAVEANEGQTWEAVMRCRALENGVFVAPCNQVGETSGLTFGGSSMVVDPLGNIIARASNVDEEILLVDVDRTLVDRARQRLPVLRDRVPGAYGAIVAP